MGIKMNNIEIITEIIKEEMSMELDPEMEIAPDMELAADLHIDSLNMVLIVGRIEEEFEVEIDYEEIVGIRTINDIDSKINELKQN